MIQLGLSGVWVLDRDKKLEERMERKIIRIQHLVITICQHHLGICQRMTMQGSSKDKLFEFSLISISMRMYLI
jgi:hypothetical protein